MAASAAVNKAQRPIRPSCHLAPRDAPLFCKEMSLLFDFALDLKPAPLPSAVKLTIVHHSSAQSPAFYGLRGTWAVMLLGGIEAKKSSWADVPLTRACVPA